MNYRHAFHAGNFADVFKHAVLSLLLKSLARKDAAFCYLDTHAQKKQKRNLSPMALVTWRWAIPLDSY